jgi:hypothetical protein
MGENYITVVNPHFQDSTPERKTFKVVRPFQKHKK